jgi:hypothetical protein
MKILVGNRNSIISGIKLVDKLIVQYSFHKDYNLPVPTEYLRLPIT